MAIDWKWAVTAAVGVLGLLLGGGFAWRAAWRVKRLIDKDDLRHHFLTREEHDAFVRSYEQWKDRVHEDFLKPFREQTAALYHQSIAIAEHGKTLQFVCAEQDRTNVTLQQIAEQLAELVTHSMQRRATDPPDSP